MSAAENHQRVDALNTFATTAAAALSRLDQAYSKLDEEERMLMGVLERVKREEASLREALKEASESGAERLARDRQGRDEAAVARLESALFESDSSEEDESSEETKSSS